MTALAVLLVVSAFLSGFVRLYWIRRGRPFVPWLRAAEDERWDRPETGIFILVWVALGGILSVILAGFLIEEEPTTMGILAWLATTCFISLVVATAVVRVIHRQRHASARDPSGQTAQSSVRVTIPGAGVALNIPDGWQSLEGDMAASASRTGGSSVDGAGDASSDVARSADVKVLLLAWRGEHGLRLQIEPTRLDSPDAIATGSRDERGSSPDSDPSVEHVDLPAGSAMRTRTSSEAAGRTIASTRYIVVRREWTYSLVFASPEPPEDHWLSIAETFECPPAGE